jgi:hypothetical protein
MTTATAADLYPAGEEGGFENIAQSRFRDHPATSGKSDTEEGWHSTLFSTSSRRGKLKQYRGCSADGETDWRMVPGFSWWQLRPPGYSADRHRRPHLCSSSLIVASFENLSDPEAPGFRTEVLRQVFAVVGQEASVWEN